MSDNPEITKVYLTGVFYFMLMNTGNNILPIVKFLKMTHMKQAFRNDDTFTSDIMHRSILGQMLPEAMVCFLENYSAEKFAEIFLGEFDTPEVIWNSEMRRMLIEKISAHIGEWQWCCVDFYKGCCLRKKYSFEQVILFRALRDTPWHDILI